MSDSFELAQPLARAIFGGTLRLAGQPGAEALVLAAEADTGALPDALGQCHGLLCLPGMEAMADDPGLLLRLSRIFGPEVEDYQNTGMAKNMIHPTVSEIFVVSNVPPGQPPTPGYARPAAHQRRQAAHALPASAWMAHRPKLPPTAAGRLAVPRRRPGPAGPGADLIRRHHRRLCCTVGGAEGQGRPFGWPACQLRRGAQARRRGCRTTPRALAPHERPQRQPLVRTHPVTGEKSLYLCESGQMDWLEGPFVGMQPGPHGDGAALLDTLMSHLTQPEFVYVHEWSKGDLIIWDNRCLLHAATWFDAEREQRVMWRTTVSGNPSAAYAGEARSWLIAS